jgi:hypothetical protein
MVSAVAYDVRCGPFDAGSMRLPARRSIGRAMSAIEGLRTTSASRMWVFAGLSDTTGGSGALSTSRMAFGGF